MPIQQKGKQAPEPLPDFTQTSSISQFSVPSKAAIKATSPCCRVRMMKRVHPATTDAPRRGGRGPDRRGGAGLPRIVHPSPVAPETSAWQGDSSPLPGGLWLGREGDQKFSSPPGGNRELLAMLRGSGPRENRLPHRKVHWAYCRMVEVAQDQPFAANDARVDEIVGNRQYSAADAQHLVR